MNGDLLFITGLHCHRRTTLSNLGGGEGEREREREREKQSVAITR